MTTVCSHRLDLSECAGLPRIPAIPASCTFASLAEPRLESPPGSSPPSGVSHVSSRGLPRIPGILLGTSCDNSAVLDWRPHPVLELLLLGVVPAPDFGKVPGHPRYLNNVMTTACRAYGLSTDITIFHSRYYLGRAGAPPVRIRRAPFLYVCVATLWTSGFLFILWQFEMHMAVEAAPALHIGFCSHPCSSS